MGYQILSPVRSEPRPRTQPSQGGLLSSAAPPRRASPARHEFDSRMGYQILSPCQIQAASNGRSPLKAADSEARLRRERASPARHEFDSRMGYHILSAVLGQSCVL